MSDNELYAISADIDTIDPDDEFLDGYEDDFDYPADEFMEG